MSEYELKIPATGKFHDEEIEAAEKESVEVLTPGVPGSCLREAIRNPIDSGIDQR